MYTSFYTAHSAEIYPNFFKRWHLNFRSYSRNFFTETMAQETTRRRKNDEKKDKDRVVEKSESEENKDKDEIKP